MADKAKIIERIKGHLLLMEEMKTKLLDVVEIANDEQLDHLSDLLEQETSVIDKIIDAVVAKELEGDHAAEFIKEMKKTMQTASSGVYKAKEKVEQEGDEQAAEDLLKDL